MIIIAEYVLIHTSHRTGQPSGQGGHSTAHSGELRGQVGHIPEHNWSKY